MKNGEQVFKLGYLWGVITLMILEESIPIYIPPPIYAPTNTVASVHYPGGNILYVIIKGYRCESDMPI